MPEPNIPQIIIPDRNIELAKFVQVHIDVRGSRLPFLKWEPGNLFRHADLLEGLLFQTACKYENFSSSPKNIIAKPKGENYELCGAGKFRFKDGIFEFFGFSVDYRIKTNEKHLVELQRLEPRFNYWINPDRLG